MATGTIAYVAVSLDGYIAAEDGSVGFLDAYGDADFGFKEFFDSIGGVVMGSTTYEQVLGWGWPYGDTPGLILTTRDLDVADGADLTFSDDDTGDAIRAFAATTAKRLWIVGGGRVIIDGMNSGAIDSLELYVMPDILGAGVPLFPEAFHGTLTLTDSHAFANGVVRLRYDCSV